MRRHRLVSADSHVVEPPDVWTRRMPAKLRDRAPRQQRFEEGDAWVIEGLAQPFPFGLRFDEIGNNKIGEDAGELSDGELKCRATVAQVGAEGDRNPGQLFEMGAASALDPPDWQHSAAGAGTVGPATEKIGASGQRLLEEPLVLERFPQDDAQQAPVTRVGHGFHPGLPLVDEALRATAIFVNQLRLDFGALA